MNSQLPYTIASRVRGDFEVRNHNRAGGLITSKTFDVEFKIRGTFFSLTIIKNDVVGAIELDTEAVDDSLGIFVDFVNRVTMETGL